MRGRVLTRIAQQRLELCMPCSSMCAMKTKAVSCDSYRQHCSHNFAASLLLALGGFGFAAGVRNTQRRASGSRLEMSMNVSIPVPPLPHFETAGVARVLQGRVELQVR